METNFYFAFKSSELAHENSGRTRVYYRQYTKFVRTNIKYREENSV